MAELTLEDLMRQFQPSPEEQQRARMQALMAAGFSLLGAPRGREWQAIGNAGLTGMNALTQTQMLNEQMRRQRLLESMQAFKLAKDVEATNAGMKMLGLGGGAPSAPAGGPPPIGEAGGMSVAPTPGAAPVPPPQPAIGSPQPWATPQTEAAFAVMGKKDIADVIHRQYQIVQGPGNTLIRNGQIVGQVVPNAGMVLDGKFVPLPREATDALLSMKRAEAGIQSEQELVNVPTTLPNGQPGPQLQQRKSDVLARLSQPAPQTFVNIDPSKGNVTSADVAWMKSDMARSAVPPSSIAPSGYGVQASPLALEQGKADIETAARERQTINSKKVEGALGQIDKQYETVSSAATNGIPLVHEARAMLDSGKVITGAAADFKTELGRWLVLAGYKQAEDPVANTQAFAATQARQVLTIIKSLGSGSGISDADREYAAKIVGGKVELDEQAIRKLLEISEQAQRNAITAHNRRVQNASGVFGDPQISSLYYVEPPKPYISKTGLGPRKLTPAEQQELNDLRRQFGRTP